MVASVHRGAAGLAQRSDYPVGPTRKWLYGAWGMSSAPVELLVRTAP